MPYLRSGRRVLTWLAANESVALEAIGAAAIGRVVGVDANGIRGAGIVDIAGMLAALVDARLRDAAVRIIGAFH